MTVAQISAAHRLYWSVRRELWEYRSIYLAPLAVAGVVLVGFTFSLFALPARMQAARTLGPPELRQFIEQPYVIAAIVLMTVELLVAIFYSVDALYGERRDRSILFWKSLPVGDLVAVVAKASIPIVVLPLVTFAATVTTQTAMLFSSSVVLTVNGLSASTLWEHVSLWNLVTINLGHLVMFHGIWYAPLYAWLLLVSAWATRVPFLWAVLPPAAIAIVERLAFNTTSLATVVQEHFLGESELAPDAPTAGMSMTMDVLTPHPLGHYLTAPGLWIGLALTAAFLVGAARLRRARGAV
jgi:ABC-2 type transport system permease protein